MTSVNPRGYLLTEGYSDYLKQSYLSINPVNVFTVPNYQLNYADWERKLLAVKDIDIDLNSFTLPTHTVVTMHINLILMRTAVIYVLLWL